MRIFTLGKNGIPLFFFALFLFSGTTIYGQECPTVGDADSIQYYCDSQETEVGDLRVTTGTDVVWYASQTSTTAIPDTRILVSGTYYAGTSANDCQNNRAEVRVVIASEPQILGTRASTTPTTAADMKQSLAVIGVCVADVNDSGLTVADLRTNAEDESNVRWYLSRSESAVALDPSTPLVNNTDYFAGVYSPDGDCETNRRKTTVRFFSEAAPTGDAVQEFCAVDNPTLGDIVATGENRYFTTEDSQTELSPSTTLVDGRTYYLSALGEDCESIERLAVTVNLVDANAGNDNLTAQACLSEIQSRLSAGESPTQIFLSLLDEGVETDGVFSPTIDELAAQYNQNPIGTFATTYTVTNAAGCQDSADLALTILANPDAGEDIFIEICSSEFEGLNDFQVVQRFLSTLQINPEDYDPAGFDPVELNALLAEFDPQNPAGEYSITYTEGSGECTDEAVITLNINESPYAGDDTTIEVSSTDAPVDLYAVLSTNSTSTPDTGGTWSNTSGTFNPANDAAGAFTYTVINENGCEDSATIRITVVDDTQPEPDIFVLLCEDEIDANPSVGEVRTYFLSQVTNNTNLPNTGTFNPTAEEILAQYQANPIGTLSTTYTVDVEGEATSVLIEVQINALQTAEAGEIADITVEDTSTTVIVLDDTLLSSNATTGGTFTAEDGILNADGNFDPSIGAGTYEITYTVDGSQFCVEGEDSTTFTITVTEETQAEPDIFVLLCEDEIDANPSVSDVRTYFLSQVTNNTDLPNTGTFNPTAEELLAQYQANPIGTLSTTYTVDVDGEATSILIEVQIEPLQTAEAGEIANVQIECGASELFILNDSLLSPDAIPGGIFSAAEGVLNADGNFDPAIGAGVYTITYIVNESLNCVEGEDSTSFTITVESSVYAGEDLNLTFCTSEIESFIANPTSAVNFFNDLLENQEGEVDTTGEFDADFTDILAYYSTGDFSEPLVVNYTVGEGECTDEATFSLTIVEDEPANTGDIENITVDCGSFDIITLDNLLSEDATPGGEFTAEAGILNADGNFDPAIGAGVYTITYTVGESTQCVTGEDSTTFTITVQEGSVEANDIFVQVCEEEVDNPTLRGFRSYFRNLVSINTDLPEGGTFEPSIEALLAQYQEEPLGTFTTNYSVETECGLVTIQVSAEILENQVANAGSISNIALTCASGDVISLDDTLLSEDATRGGDFSAENGVLNAEGNFDPSIGTGEYVITYTVDETIACVEGTDSTTFTITVTEGDTELEAISLDLCSSEIDPDPTASSVRAYFMNVINSNTDLPSNGNFTPSEEEILEDFLNDPFGEFTTTYSVETECGMVSVEVTVNVLESLYAGEDATVTLTEEDTEIVDLFDALGGTPDEGGTWTDEEGNTIDGTFDPTTDEAGEFTYTISSENGCEDFATVTVVFETDQNPCAELPATPTVTAFNGCVVDGATVADLEDNITVDEGNTFTVYTDASLETPAADTDVLTEGEYFVTQTNAEGCESEAATITVTLGDNDAPTLSLNGNTFCTSDNATLADLEEFVSANGDITWYTTQTGGEALTNATALQDDVTYYAASTGVDSDCESSERLAVTVTLEECEIPEAFSPNGDRKNDRFYVKNLTSNYPNHMMEIYNRWGDVVFKGQAGENQGWDGTATEGRFGSGTLPVGVYFYILYFNDGQTAPTQGRVYLSR